MFPPGTHHLPVGMRAGAVVVRSRLAAALADARDRPHDEAVAELARIAALADAAGDVRASFDARYALMEAYQQHAEGWRLREPLTWCLAAVDRDPAAFPAQEVEQLLRFQQAAVAAFCGTPRAGLGQTGSLLDDLERRSVGDAGRRVVHRLRGRIADHLGDEPAARHWLDRWWTDAGADETCAGCAAVERARLLAGWGEWSEAVRAAEPAATEASGCTEQPEAALTVLLLPYLRAGRAEEAGRAHVRAYRRHRRERTAFPYLATHLRFCALAGHPARGLDLLAEQLPRLGEPHDDLSTMEFAAAGALVCRLAGEAGLGDRVVVRPARPELTVAALGAELLAVARDLAGRFDARNGTGHQSGRISSWLAGRPLADPVPLPEPEVSPEGTEPEWPG